jgi:hypothetical protein
MTNTYSWAINALDTYPIKDSLSDVVYNIHWSMIATSDQTDVNGNPYTASSIGTQIVTVPDADGFIAFDDLTQEIVEGWLEASELDVDSIKANLDAQIEEKITPKSVTRVIPWENKTI